MQPSLVCKIVSIFVTNTCRTGLPRKTDWSYEFVCLRVANLAWLSCTQATFCHDNIYPQGRVVSKRSSIIILWSWKVRLISFKTVSLGTHSNLNILQMMGSIYQGRQKTADFVEQSTKWLKQVVSVQEHEKCILLRRRRNCSD